MKLEAQRMAIAEACGWTQQPWDDGSGRVSWITPSQCYGDLPNHLTDLNAMHDAEKTLKAHGNVVYQGGVYHSQQALYVCLLLGVEQWPALGHDATALFDLAHATAAQRAEAFLRATNRWREDAS